MKAIVLNYTISAVDVYDIPEFEKDKINTEGERILQDLGCHTSSCSWMFVDEPTVPVFYNECEEPVAIL